LLEGVGSTPLEAHKSSKKFINMTDWNVNWPNIKRSGMLSISYKDYMYYKSFSTAWYSMHESECEYEDVVRKFHSVEMPKIDQLFCISDSDLSNYFSYLDNRVSLGNLQSLKEAKSFFDHYIDLLKARILYAPFLAKIDRKQLGIKVVVAKSEYIDHMIDVLSGKQLFEGRMGWSVFIKGANEEAKSGISIIESYLMGLEHSRHVGSTGAYDNWLSQYDNNGQREAWIPLDSEDKRWLNIP
jgi:hypothetical protein